MKNINKVSEENSEAFASEKITYRYVEVNGIKLHVAIAGPISGNPVILLHGFPDASFGWEKQILDLAQNNFYVIAPDQRGYNLSDKPKGEKSYMMNLLSGDIIALADALGIKQFSLAGHDKLVPLLVSSEIRR